MNIEDFFGSKVRARILKQTFSLPNKQHSIRSLSLLIKCSYGQTYDEVQSLVSMGVLKKSDAENNGKISLNRDHADYKELHKIFAYDRAQVSNRLLNDMEPIKTELLKHKFVTIISHHNADPDSLGSAVALSIGLRQLNIASEVLAPGGISKQMKAVLEKMKYPVGEQAKQQAELVLVLDSSSREQVENFDFAGKKMVLIDHHEKGDLFSLASLALLDTSASSTAILTLKFLQFLNVKLTGEIKYFLAVGMITDSAFLRRMNAEDLEAFELVLGEFSIDELVKILSSEEDISERIAKLKSFKRIETWQIGGKISCFSIIRSFESSCALALVRTGADAAFVFNTSNDELRVSGRCRPSFGINLAEILKKTESAIEGHAGGHATAASANGKNSSSVENAKKIILNELRARLKGESKRIN